MLNEPEEDLENNNSVDNPDRSVQQQTITARNFLLLDSEFVIFVIMRRVSLITASVEELKRNDQICNQAHLRQTDTHRKAVGRHNCIFDLSVVDRTKLVGSLSDSRNEQAKKWDIVEWYAHIFVALL